MEALAIRCRVKCCFIFMLIAFQIPMASAQSNRTFNILVPNKPMFKTQFLDCRDPSNVKGFCIDLFMNAFNILSPKPVWPTSNSVKFTCYKISAEANDTRPTYDGMVENLSKSSKYDAVVGDITISASRLEFGNFTQAYLDSGIVILTKSSFVPYMLFDVFFKPFERLTWALMGLSVVMTGFVVWLMEYHQSQRIPKSLSELSVSWWHVASILIFQNREIKHSLTKFLMVAWILFTILLSASYTASLSSILTVRTLSKTTTDLTELAQQQQPIGYEVGSIVRDYLTTRFNITNLVPLNNTKDFATTLHLGPDRGGVAAIVDEIPYINLFLSSLPTSECKFSVSPKLTFEGFGFAFRDASLASAFSIAILNLSETGQIQTLEDGSKLSNYKCPSQMQSTQLDILNVVGLFVILGGVSVAWFGGQKILRWIKLCKRSTVEKKSSRITLLYESQHAKTFRIRVPSEHDLTLEEMS